MDSVWWFLFWLYCSLSWFTMALRMFTPNTDDHHIPALHLDQGDKLSIHIVGHSLILALAPVIWLVCGIYLLWKRWHYRYFRALCRAMGHTPCV